MVVGRERLSVEGLSNHHTCRLGKWYDAVQDPLYKNNPVFAGLIEPHQRVHSHGIEAVKHFNAGRLDAALQEIAAVEAASKEVLQMLAALEGKAA
jgi:methyl-accepting chemotaxis protein